MGKLIKSILLVFCSIIFVVILGAIALLLWIDPNNLKSPIEKAVYQTTGKKISIEGDINWTFFPALTLEVNNIQLANPPGFSEQPMAKLEQADIGIQVLPLLKGQIETKHVKIIGLNLYAETLKNGQSNWNDALKLSSQSSQEPVKPIKETGKAAIFELHINKIAVVDSNLHWLNYQQASQGKVNIKQLTVDDFNTEGKDFNLALTGSIKNDKNPKSQILKLTSKNQLNLEKHSFGTTFQANFAKMFTSNGQLNANFSESLNFDGNIVVTNQNKSQASCQLKGDKLTVDLSDCKIDYGNNHIQAHMQINNWMNYDQAKMQGNIHADKLQLDRISVQNLDTQLTMHDKRWQFNPITADFYQGKYQGQITIDMSTSQTVYQVNQQIKGTQIQALLNDINQSSKITGTLNSRSNINTQGNTADEIKQHISGQVSFEINQGNIQGLNITALMQNAYAQFKHLGNSKQPSNSGETKFTKVSADFNVVNGIANTKNLNLTSPLAKVTAEGSVNLINNAINFDAEVQLNQDSLPNINLLQKQAGGTIPFVITGTLNNPVIRPDMTSLLKLIARPEWQKNVDKVEKKLDKVGGEIGTQLKSLFNNKK